MLSWSRFALDIIRSNTRTLKRPYRFFLVVTKSCQSRCQHCKIWKETPQDELTLEEIRRLARNSRWLKWLNISGGEPTDRTDLPEIMAAFREACPDLLMANFTTNGIRPDHIFNQVEKISALGIPRFHVNVSIDGPGEVHDRLRGTPGNYQNAIRLLKEVRKLKNVEVSAALTLYPKNIDLVDQTFQGIRAEIPDFEPGEMHFNLPHMSSHFYGNTQMNIVPPAAALDTVEDFLRRHRVRGSSLSLVENIYRRYARAYVAEGRSPLPCTAVMSSVYVSEKGEIYPCTIWDRPLGNLRQHDYNILGVLNEEAARQARADAQGLKCPQCWTPCEAFPSIMGNVARVLAR